MTDDLQLLLARGDGSPVLRDGLGAGEITGDAAPEDDSPDHLWEEGDDPNELTSQRWGVLAPQGPLGDRLLALVAPLIEHRRQQQGGAPVKIYRVPPRLGPAEALLWRRRVFEAGGGLRVDLPRYQLLLGDLDVMPLSVQYAFAGDGFPGRLAFADEDGYSAYVSKVLRWETSAETAPASALLCGVRDGSSATELGRRALLRPGLDLLQQSWESGSLDVASLSEVDTGDDPSPDPLLARAAAARSAVLFSLSHGEGLPPRSDPATRRARQGAMCFGRAGALTGADLERRPFLPGGMWCMLACYSAGTPDGSAYRHWLESLQSAGRYFGRPTDVLAALPGPGEPPFIAALPQAALRNPDGPLAFVGHIDLAWTYGFQDLDGRVVTRPGRLMALVRSLLRGDRAGVGLRELARGVAMANSELTCLIDQDTSMCAETGPDDHARRAHLWLLRQDLSAYVLLGDPAARLPIPRDPEEPPPSYTELRQQMSSGPEVDDDTLLRHESAIARALAGAPIADIARDIGLDPNDLSAALAAYRDAGRLALRRHLSRR